MKNDMGKQIICNMVQLWPLRFDSPLLFMKVSLGIQRKNSSHHFSLPTYGENPMSPDQIHIDQPSQTLNDHHGWSAVSGALSELPH